MLYFSIFSKNLTNRELIFLAFARKTLIDPKYWENFDENSIEKMEFLTIFEN